MKAQVALALATMIGAAYAQQAPADAALASLRAAVARCKAELDAPKTQRLRVSNGTFSKTLTLGGEVKFDAQKTDSLINPIVATVDIEILTATAMAYSQFGLDELSLTDQSMVMKSESHYRFGWQDGRWALIEGGRERVSFRKPGARAFEDPASVPIRTTDGAKGSSQEARCARMVLGAPME